MEILFIRHAQPEWVRDGRGVLDPPLTTSGEAQVAHLVEAAGRWSRPPSRLLVSPTRRSRATAGPLADRLGLKPEILPWLEEMRLPPDWEGAPAERMAAVFHQARQRGMEEWQRGFPGGECFADFEARVTRHLAETVGLGDRPGEPGLFRLEPKKERWLVVAHAGTNAVAISWLLGLPQVPWAWERFVTAHASVTRLKAVHLSGGWIFSLREHSDVGHLPPDLRSR